MENNGLSEHEACYRSSTPNNSTKSELTSMYIISTKNLCLPSIWI